MNTSTLNRESAPTEPAPCHWSVDRLYLAIDAGVFDHPERLELVHGELLQKKSQNPEHSGLSDILAALLREVMQPAYVVREEKPLRIATDAEPVPDIMVVQGERADYVRRHASPLDVVLLVEISDKSSSYDLQDKALLYSQAGIADYWVIVVPSRELVVFRSPSQEGYQSVSRLSAGAEVSPLAAEASSIAVADVFAALNS